MSRTLPKVGLSKLAALRSRERLFHVAWGWAKWLTVVVAVAAVFMLIDWRVDKFRETPQWVRVPLSLVLFAVAAIAGWFWLIRSWSKVPSVIDLARRVEQKVPVWDHKLVTSIQLNADKAQVGTMSPQLIEQVTQQSESLADQTGFGQFADLRLVKWAAGLTAVPLLIAAALIGIFGFELVGVLIQRQAFGSVDIPRFNRLENITPELWPAGDEVTVRYEVYGPIDDDVKGVVRIRPEGLPADDYVTTLESRPSPDVAVFAVKIPRSSVAFSHRAWIGDGRTRSAGTVRFEPRPVVSKIDAWVQTPRFLGNRPNGSPYEQYQLHGELTGLSAATARLRISVQKPISEAQITLFERTPDNRGDRRHSTISMNITNGRDDESSSAEVSFDLAPALIAYQVTVKDRYGFANDTPPRRGIRILPDDPPLVRLLPERYAEPGAAISDQDIIEGLPIPLGGQIPIAYTCRSFQGVGKARLMYRVNDKGPWIPLPLREVDASAKTGPFDPNRGTFAGADPHMQVEFHAAPSLDRETLPDYLSGGGHFDFQTAKLTRFDEETGKVTDLKIGDRVEFYVEVFDRNPAADRKPGRSEARIKEVLSATDVLLRLDQTRAAEGKIRDLEKRQRGIFGIRLPD